MKKNKWIFKSKYVIFYWANRFDISFELCGYFDNRPRINLDLIFFSLCLILPFRNEWTDECDPPKWGLSIHNSTIWIYRGGKGNDNGGNKWWTWNIPFLTKEWYRTSILLKDDTWEHKFEGQYHKEFYNDVWKAKQKKWLYNFIDDYDNQPAVATIYIEEWEWRPKWLMWTNIFNKVRKSIDVHFDVEVGKGKSDWKGGITRIGFEMIGDEDPIKCFNRNMGNVKL